MVVVQVEVSYYYTARQDASKDLIRQRRQDINRTLDEQTEQLFKDSDKYKSTKMLSLNLTTPEQNMFNMFGDKQGEIINEALFWAVDRNEAQRYRWLNSQYDKVRTFPDSKGKQSKLSSDEDALVQMVVEGRAAAEMITRDVTGNIKNAAENITKGRDPYDEAREFGLSEEDRELAERYALWLETKDILKSGKVDAVKVENAAKTYMEIYDLYHIAINEFRVAHGYEPIGFIQGYAPHMQPEENYSLVTNMLKAMGMGDSVSKLPAGIAGLTKGFTPNMRWNPHFQTRHGDKTAYSITKGFQRYTEFLSDILHHTDDIMRVRAASRYFRRTYAPENISESISQAQRLQYGSIEDKEDYLREARVINEKTKLSQYDILKMMDEHVEGLYASIKDLTKYSNLVMYLDNYANLLAGKQSMADRGGEELLGRESLNIGNKILQVFGRVKVGGSLTSAINQLSQWPDIVAENGPVYTARAINDFINGKIYVNTWEDESDYLTGKQGVDNLVTSAGNKLLETLFTPTRVVDYFTSSVAFRSKYLKEIAAGKTHSKAVSLADEYARSLVGSRMKGSRPLVYDAKNLALKMVTMFQREVGQRWEHKLKYNPRQYRNIKSEPQAGYDHRQRRVTVENNRAAANRTAAAWVVGSIAAGFIMNTIVKELTGVEPDAFDVLGIIKNTIAAGSGLSGNDWLRVSADNGFEALFGTRPFGTDRDSISDDFDWGAALSDAGRRVSYDLPYLRNVMGLLGLGDNRPTLPDLVSPGQDIADAIKNDGALSWATGRALLGLGSEALPGGAQLKRSAEGAESMLRGGRYRGDNDNSRLQYPVKNGFWDVVRATMFGNRAMPETDRFYASDMTGLTANQTAVFEALVAGGAGRQAAYDAIQEWRRIGNDKDAEPDSYERGRQQRDVIRNMNISDEQKLELYAGLTPDSESRAEKFDALMDEGLTWDDIMDVYDKYAEIKTNEGTTASRKATDYAQWVDERGYTRNQAEAIKTQLTFWTSVPADASRYEALVEAGLDTEDAYNLSNALAALEPMPGKSSVAPVQRYKAIVDTGLSDEDKAAAIGTFMKTETETEDVGRTSFEKLMDAVQAGITVDDYMGVYFEIHAINEDKTVKGASAANEKRDVIAGTGMSDMHKIELYRAFVSENNDEKIAEFNRAGLPFDSFLEAQNEYATINETDLKATEKATEFSRWVNAQTFTPEQAAVARDTFTFFNMVPAEAGRYNSFVEAGLSEENSYGLTNAIMALQPLDGKENVSDLQRYRAAVDTLQNEDDQVKALSALMKNNESQYRNVRVSVMYNIAPEEYIRALEILAEINTDGGAPKNDEVTLALNRLLGPTSTQRAVLWQLLTGSTSARNNPYDRNVGEDALARIDALKAWDAWNAWEEPQEDRPALGASRDLPALGTANERPVLGTASDLPALGTANERPALGTSNNGRLSLPALGSSRG